MRHHLHTFGIITLLIALATITAPTEANIVFVDNFNNGVPADSDNVVGFWDINQTADVPGQESVTISESTGPGGELTITLVDEGTNNNVRPIAALVSDVRSDFAFNNSAGTTYSVDFALNTGGEGAPYAHAIRFWVSPEKSAAPQGAYSAADAMTVGIVANGKIVFGWKTDKPGVVPFDQVPTGMDDWRPSVGTYTGIDLTLDDTGWELVVHGTSSSATRSGLFSDTESGFIPWGDSSIGITSRESEGSTNARTFTSTIQQVQVEQIPEPASLSIVAGFASALLLRRRH